jgi:hypothetical protein
VRLPRQNRDKLEEGVGRRGHEGGGGRRGRQELWFEWRTVTAERKLQELGILVRYDENDNPTFVTVK